MLSHLGFLVLEMFFWTEPVGHRIFETTPEFAAASKVLAANQGLYNRLPRRRPAVGPLERPARREGLLPVPA